MNTGKFPIRSGTIGYIEKQESITGPVGSLVSGYNTIADE